MEFRIEKSELIKGLSYAIDIAEKKYLSHAKLVTFIAMEIGKVLNLSDYDMELLYYSSLLHDIGAGEQYDILEHCVRGDLMTRQLPLDIEISKIILHHHEFIDGSGPLRKKGYDIPLLAQIVHLANHFDFNFANENIDVSILLSASKKMSLNLNGKFDTEILAAFETVARNINETPLQKESFTDYDERSFYIPNVEYYCLEDIKAFAEVFANIIDNRSEFTHTHSIGLTSIVDRMTKRFAFSKEHSMKMYIASLLHDIGKLGVDNKLIDKPGKLSADERIEIEKHAYHTHWILSKIKGFEDIAKWASHHHEKLNGSGYPFALKADELSLEERLMAICDIFQALSEDRPYRNKMSKEKVWIIIDSMVESEELDSSLVNELKSEFGVI